MPRHNGSVTRHDPECFLVEFTLPSEKDRALCKGFIETGGSSFPICPWRPVGGGTEHTWWYHVKVSMENVPMEAWNDDGVKLILGDACILDRLDSRTLAREATELLTY